MSSLVSVAVVILVGVLVFALGGCATEERYGRANQTVVAEDGKTMNVKDTPAVVPELERVYSDTIRGLTVKVTAKVFIGSRMLNGEIDQPDGRWVLFEPENVANRILDRELAPLVQAFCDRVIKADDEYRRHPPASYTDASGTTWVRK